MLETEVMLYLHAFYKTGHVKDSVPQQDRILQILKVSAWVCIQKGKLLDPSFIVRKLA